MSSEMRAEEAYQRHRAAGPVSRGGRLGPSPVVNPYTPPEIALGKIE